MAAANSILGNVSKEQFLTEYWQKKPLLVRQALPAFKSPLSPEELAGLSLEENSETRLITGDGKQQPWELHHGPFKQTLFTALPEKNWTLLVQAVDLWVPEVQKLLENFGFLPRWRVDDIMVSYAAEGGGVGPHFDYYDVFLLQGAGQRRWQIGDYCDGSSPLLNDVGLKILQNFNPRHTWDLQPGDMLYLPPRIAHCGVSLDSQCMTYSLGFRAPTAAEMLADLATELMSQERQHYYNDPPLTPEMARAELPQACINQVRKLLMNVLDNETLLADWFARYMTSPKYPELLDNVGLPTSELIANIKNGTISELSPNSRYLKTEGGFYLDGEKLE